MFTRSMVYLIEGGGLLKIGHSRNPRGRLGAMRTGSPVPLRLLSIMGGGPCRESRLHERFKRHRRHGEWFADHADIRAAFGVQ